MNRSIGKRIKRTKRKFPRPSAVAGPRRSGSSNLLNLLKLVLHLNSQYPDLTKDQIIKSTIITRNRWQESDDVEPLPDGTARKWFDRRNITEQHAIERSLSNLQARQDPQTKIRRQTRENERYQENLEKSRAGKLEAGRRSREKAKK